ncbi:MAG: class B sortase [Ruminococcus sp.]|nr:class B sortase [Ruminococcus sp.]
MANSKLEAIRDYLIPNKSDNKSEKLRKIVFIFSVIVFIASLVQLGLFLRNKGVQESYQKELLSYAPQLDDEPAKTTETSSPGSKDTSKPEPDTKKAERTIQPWAQKLLNRNKDVVGWLSIPSLTDSSGSAYINTVVVKGKNNEEYLNIDLDKKYSETGTIFIDHRCDIQKDSQSDNITIYGHHMNYLGTGFAHLHEYKQSVDVLRKNAVVNFNTIYDGTNQKYAIIGCFVTNAFEGADNGNIFRYWDTTNFKKDGSDFKQWIAEVNKRSWYASDIKCTAQDDYITLSTCSDEVWGIRWVIVAKKLTANDDIEKIKSSYRAKADKDIYFPANWVNKIGNKPVYYGWDY